MQAQMLPAYDLEMHSLIFARVPTPMVGGWNIPENDGHGLRLLPGWLSSRSFCAANHGVTY